jgi:hypothetical protein
MAACYEFRVLVLLELGQFFLSNRLYGITPYKYSDTIQNATTNELQSVHVIFLGPGRGRSASNITHAQFL